jgi:hypothetical protein
MIILYKQYTPEEHQDIIYFSKKYRFSIQKTHKYTLYAGDITRVLYLLQKQ